MRKHGSVHEPIDPATSPERLKAIRAKHVSHGYLKFCVGCGENWPCDVSIVLEWLDLTSAILQTADESQDWPSEWIPPSE